MTLGELLLDASSRFMGFSLEKREEWKQGPWRCRIIPNKTTRQDYRIEVYGATPEEALTKAIQRREEVAAQNRAEWEKMRQEMQTTPIGA